MIPTTFTSKTSTPRVAKAVEEIQRLKYNPKQIGKTSQFEHKTFKQGMSTFTCTPVEDQQELSSTTHHSKKQENSKITKNRTTKLTPFEAHLLRKSNNALTNIATKPKKQLIIQNIKNFSADQRLIKQALLPAAAMWYMKHNSERELIVWYKENTRTRHPRTNGDSNESQDSKGSNNAPLLRPTRIPDHIWR